MKRQIHFCDACGAQMTHVDSDGDASQVGITIHGSSEDGFASASLLKLHDCGTSSTRTYLQGREFCSFKCFEVAAQNWVESMRTFFEGRPRA